MRDRFDLRLALRESVRRLEDHELVAAEDGRQAMRDNQGAGVSSEHLIEPSLNGRLSLGIERAGRLVDDHEPRLLDRRCSDHHTLSFPSRKLDALLPDTSLEPFAETRAEVDAEKAHHAPDLVIPDLGPAPIRETVDQVLADGPVEDLRALRDVAEHLLPARDPDATQVVSVDANRSSSGIHCTVQESRDRALPGTRGTDQSNLLTLLHREADAAQHLLRHAVRVRSRTCVRVRHVAELDANRVLRSQRHGIFRLRHLHGKRQRFAKAHEGRSAPVDLTFDAREEAHLLTGHASPRENADQLSHGLLAHPDLMADVQARGSDPEPVEHRAKGRASDVGEPDAAIHLHDRMVVRVHVPNLAFLLPGRLHALHELPALVPPAVDLAKRGVQGLHGGHDVPVEHERQPRVDEDRRGHDHARNRIHERQHEARDHERVERIDATEQKLCLHLVEPIEPLLDVRLREPVALFEVQSELLRKEHLVHAAFERHQVLAENQLDVVTRAPLREATEQVGCEDADERHPEGRHVVAVDRVDEDPHQERVEQADESREQAPAEHAPDPPSRSIVHELAPEPAKDVERPPHGRHVLPDGVTRLEGIVFFHTPSACLKSHLRKNRPARDEQDVPNFECTTLKNSTRSAHFLIQTQGFHRKHAQKFLQELFESCWT